MGNRTGFYFGGKGKGHTPSTCVAVVVEPTIAADTPESAVLVPMTFSRVHAVASRKTHRGWTKETARTFDAPESFWAWLETWAQRDRKTYVWAPIASDALTLLRFWPRVDRLGGRFKGTVLREGERVGAGQLGPAFRFDRLVLRGKPDIVEYTFCEKSYLWLSGHQFLSMTDDDLADTVGFRRSGTSRYGWQPARATWTDHERAALWHRAAKTLGHWWGSLEAGGFGRTVGSMALNFLRSRTAPKTVATHTDERAIRLERLACHGGRASTWFYGTCQVASQPDAPPETAALPARRWVLPERLYHVDVRSMYPFLLSSIDTPCKLVTFRTDLTPADLVGILKGMEAIAYVTLRTDSAEYPHRRGAFVVYPTGRFRTVLCGPELRTALHAGEVERVHQVALYTRGKPFADAASELLAMRRSAACTGNSGWEAFVKLLSNSLTGKLAQRGATWLPRPRVCPEREWGEWLHSRPGQDRPTRYRALAGMVWECVRDNPGTGLLTAIYAHITSAGRAHMRALRSTLPTRSVYSQDTDGMWVDASAVAALRTAGLLGEDRPGTLRVLEHSDLTRFHSPKHYYAAGRWVLSGLHHPQQSSDGLAFHDSWNENPITGGCDAPPVGINHHVRSVTLDCVPHDGTVGDDGWLIPLELPERHFPGPPPSPDPPAPPPELPPELFDAA